MDEWLKSPRKYAPGTKMSFAGLSSPEDRANLIVYMNAQGSNLPLPPVEEVAIADAAEGAAEGAAPAAEGAAAPTDAAAEPATAPAEAAK